MKKVLKTFVAILAAFIVLTPAPSCAKASNTVNIHGHSIKGKITTVADGLIILQTKGVSQSYIREEDTSDQNPDYITFRRSALSRKTLNVPCYVLFVDTWVVKIKTAHTQQVEIPRYRVTNIEINIK